VLNVGAFVAVGGMGVLAPGLNAQVVLLLAPGTYAAASFVPDVATGEPDAALGMIAVFVVE
jgi:hypothetical protein